MTDLPSLLQALSDRQQARLLRLSFPLDDGPDAELLVERLQASEYLSRDFEYRVLLLSDDATLRPEDLLGKLLCVSLVRRDRRLRPFTGYVYSFESVRTDGGVAFYEVLLVPWFRFLALRQNNRLFHDRPLGEQASEIFEDYVNLSRWAWRVRDEQPRHTMSAQFQESDHNYLSWRMEAAGYAYFYEHDERGHSLEVMADTRMAADIDAAGPGIRFHAEGDSREEDTITRFSPIQRVTPTRGVIGGYDFKDARPTVAGPPGGRHLGAVPPLEVYAYEGHYGFKGGDGARSLAARRMEEVRAHGAAYEAAGTNRSVAAGRCFKLTDHHDPSLAELSFLVTEVHHEASNNYLQSTGTPATYSNRFVCVDKQQPWRPGLGYASTPTRILAPQTATVIGPESHGSLNVDVYGRVQVQFHWDRARSYSSWVRVASNWAGGENGLASHPRVGSEVVVQWLDGHPDHPLVTACVHNESHMPPWKLPGQKHLTGLRTRELVGQEGNTPAGRSNHLILDDTPRRIQAQLRSDHQASQLSVGHIARIEDNAGRKDLRGQGFELRTDGVGVQRAARGMLLTTEPRPDARAHITDMGETVERLASSHALHEGLSDAAQRAKAHEPGDQDLVTRSLLVQANEVRGSGGDPAQGEFPEYSAPHLTLASPAGVQATAQGTVHLSSVEHVALTGGDHVSIAAGRSLLASARKAIRMVAHEVGMRLVAASGDVDITALKNSIHLLAQLDITQTAERITLSAKTELRVEGGGSYTHWNASGITHGTPGRFEVHAASHELTGPDRVGPPALPQGRDLGKGLLDVFHDYTSLMDVIKRGVKQGPFDLGDADDKSRSSALDGEGYRDEEEVAMGGAEVNLGPDPSDSSDAGSYRGEHSFESKWVPGVEPVEPGVAG